MRSLVLCFCLLVSSNVDAAERIRPDIVRVAVRDFQVEDVDERLEKVVHSAFVKELRKYRGVSLISMDEVRELLKLEADKMTAGCSEGECLTEIADALGADQIIIGSIAMLGDDVVFTVKRVSQSQAKILKTASRRIKFKKGEGLLAAVGPITQELLSDFTLRPGQEVGVDKTLALVVNPPPVPRTLTLGVAAATGAVFVAASAVLGVNVALRSQVDDDIQRSERTGVPLPEDYVAQTQPGVDRSANASYALWGTFALGALGTGVLALVTDWADHRNAENF